ncbi:11487_t:CDS:2, partial [Scutellospora calospora]
RKNLTNELPKLYERAFDTANQAVNEDRNGNKEKAKRHYLEVVNIFGSIVQIEPDQVKRNKILTKCHEYRMRIEQLGGESTLDSLLKQAQTIQNQAKLQDEQKNYIEALTLYTKAAEIFIEAIKETKDASRNKQLTTEVKQLFDRAEELKGLPTRRTLLAVQSANHGTKITSSCKLTQKEIDILKHTSFINERRFLPWLETDLNEEFKYEKPFVDLDGPLSLSIKQKENFGAWRRPHQIMENPKMIVRISSSTIKQ